MAFCDFATNRLEDFDLFSSFSFGVGFLPFPRHLNWGDKQ